MNRMQIQRLLVTITLILVASFATAQSQTEDRGFGAAGALQAEDYTLEEMLMYAVQDEFLARAEYAAIIETWGVDRPFTNIIRSEEQHIAALTPLFSQHGVEMPEDTAAQHTVIPESLEQAFSIGVNAEVENIAMYASFLAQDNLHDDVRWVFEALMRGSENHLRAFEQGLVRETRQSARSETQRGGPAGRRPSMQERDGQSRR